MKLALHRSITFWSGILVMGFVGWAWWDSMTRQSYCQHDHAMVSSGYAGVFLSYDPQAGHPFKISGGWSLDQKLSKAIQEPFFVQGRGLSMEAAIAESQETGSLRGAVYQGLAQAPPSHWTLFLPYWLILLAVAAVWTALLLWRARRRKRTIEATELAL